MQQDTQAKCFFFKIAPKLLAKSFNKDEAEHTTPCKAPYYRNRVVLKLTRGSLGGDLVGGYWSDLGFQTNMQLVKMGVFVFAEHIFVPHPNLH